jgi:hypothetical protein
MKIVSWILYVVITNANGDPSGIVEMEPRFDSKTTCKEKAVSMRLYIENYGCLPVLTEESS